jgi:hypothetical protein
MNQSIHLRVMSPLLALAATADYVTIPETAVIETTDDLAEPGFTGYGISVKACWYFTRDIQERTQRISMYSTLVINARSFALSMLVMFPRSRVTSSIPSRGFDFSLLGASDIPWRFVSQAGGLPPLRPCSAFARA